MAAFAATRGNSRSHCLAPSPSRGGATRRPSKLGRLRRRRRSPWSVRRTRRTSSRHPPRHRRARGDSWPTLRSRATTTASRGSTEAPCSSSVGTRPRRRQPKRRSTKSTCSSPPSVQRAIGSIARAIGRWPPRRRRRPRRPRRPRRRASAGRPPVRARRGRGCGRRTRASGASSRSPTTRRAPRPSSPRRARTCRSVSGGSEEEEEEGREGITTIRTMDRVVV